MKLVRKGRKPTAGARLTRELTKKGDPFARTALITQAARLADRLEVIDRLMRGDADAWLAVRIAGQVAHVGMTDVAREERQLSAVFNKLIVDIEKLGDAAGGPDPSGPQQNRLAEIVAAHYGERKQA